MMLARRGYTDAVSAPYVAQQLARPRAGLAVVLDGHLAIDENVAIAGAALYAAPLAAGEVVRLLDRRHGEVVEVVDDDVRRLAFLERAAIGEAGAVGRQGRQL